MEEETGIVVREESAPHSDLAIMPVMDIEIALKRRNAIVEFTKRAMKEGIDYGRIPGTDKDTLLKPGAEKLTTLFGLSPQFPLVEKELDWTGADHGGEPFFYFQYKCQLFRGDLLVGEGVGSCNSWEKKYRYRMANRICPQCGSDAVIKGKEEYGGGWLCFAKKGGCGAKWEDGAEVIESQEVGLIKNENPQDLVNTIDKMAQKRSLTAATLIAVNASEFFTQDLEDMEIVEGKFTEHKEKSEPKKTTNGTRPLTPEYLHSALAMKAEGKFVNGEASIEQVGLAMGMLEACFAGDENSEAKRRSILTYLFNVDSGKDLSGAQVLALLDWLKPTKDSGGAYAPDPMAAKEATPIVRQHMIDSGQEEIPF